MVDIQGFIRKVKFAHGELSAVSYQSNDNVRKIILFCDIFRSNYEEVQCITKYNNMEIICKKIREIGAKKVIITMGEDGAYGFDGISYYECPSFSYNVKDPTGAGDVFNAAFLVKYLECNGIRDSMIFASVGTSIFLEREWDQNNFLSKFPSEDEITERISKLNLLLGNFKWEKIQNK